MDKNLGVQAKRPINKKVRACEASFAFTKSAASTQDVVSVVAAGSSSR
jgi:hypothetical protein